MILTVNRTLILCITKNKKNLQSNYDVPLILRHISISETLTCEIMYDLEMIKYGTFYDKMQPYHLRSYSEKTT